MTSEAGPGLITVPGRGAVRVDPDVATIRLGVVVVRPTAGEARSAAASAMQAVLDVAGRRRRRAGRPPDLARRAGRGPRLLRRRAVRG